MAVVLVSRSVVGEAGEKLDENKRRLGKLVAECEALVFNVGGKVGVGSEGVTKEVTRGVMRRLLGTGEAEANPGRELTVESHS